MIQNELLIHAKILVEILNYQKKKLRKKGGSFIQNLIVIPAKILEVTLLGGSFLQKSFVIPA